MVAFLVGGVSLGGDRRHNHHFHLLLLRLLLRLYLLSVHQGSTLLLLQGRLTNIPMTSRFHGAQQTAERGLNVVLFSLSITFYPIVLLHCMIDFWHHTVVFLSVCNVVCIVWRSGWISCIVAFLEEGDFLFTSAGTFVVTACAVAQSCCISDVC